MTVVAQYVTIRGRVQGVYYRVHLQQAAKAHQVVGWCRNCADGSVEAWLQGDAKAIQHLLEWCYQGSPQSVVQNVHTQQMNVDDSHTHFEIRR